MKTTPMAHQLVGQERLDANPAAFALAAEQGTGKTWMLLNDAERQFMRGRINALLVVAPKGVHTNWVRREIPKHMSIPVRSGHWKSGAGVRHMAKLETLLHSTVGELVVLSMNIDALNTKTGEAFAERFLMTHEAMMVIDESSRIKTQSSGRTKACVSLGKLAKSRRIASGTMITNGPLDAFAQFEFLAPGKGLLGTRSYRAFVAEYAEVLPPDNNMVKAIKAKARGNIEPQIVARDTKGRPKYRNLDKLRALMAPYTYRVLKKDCLDLPEKIYQVLTYELEPAQRKIYDMINEELMYLRPDDDVDRFTALTKMTKIRQAVSGFLMVDGEATVLVDDHPRLQLLREIVEDTDGKFIVWATFREELAQIGRALDAMGISHVQYHGGVKDADRELAVDGFQEGDTRAFVGQQQSGGIGLTLTAAEHVIYYSSDFSLENRLQSEDRAHRIGTVKNVLYTDLAAADTIDEKIAYVLQSKGDVASAILDGR